PYAGVVTKRLVELGETVAPGTPLLSGFSLDTLRVEVDLPQSALTLAREPADVQVVLPDGKRVTPVKLTRFNYADSLSHAFRLRLDLPPQTAGVLPGMWLKVQLKQGERQVLQVPDRALLRQGEFNGVYLQQPAGWALTPVRVGHCVEGQCEILAGLQAGDKLAPDAWAQQQEVAHE
ncbi:hemolysin D, partial [Aeromonas salmonicida subsp. salmonicida]